LGSQKLNETIQYLQIAADLCFINKYLIIEMNLFMIISVTFLNFFKYIKDNYNFLFFYNQHKLFVKIPYRTYLNNQQEIYDNKFIYENKVIYEI
jgi:hypothetical protein